MTKSKALLIILSAVFVLGQFGRIPVSADITLHLNDIAVGILGGLGILGVIRMKKKPRLTKPILLFAGAALFSLLINSTRYQFREIIAAFSYWLRWVAYAGLYFYLAGNKRNWAEQAPRFMIIAGVLVAVGGFLQYFLYPDLNALAAGNWDPHYYRLVGTFLDPAFTGAILVLSLIVITVFNFKSSIIKISIWAFVYLAMALTYSRASYLMYFTSMSLIAFFNKSLKFWLFVVVLGAVTIAVLPRPGGEGTKLERQTTIRSRTSNWQTAAKIFSENPVFGVGFNAYRYAQRDYGYLDEKWQETHSGAGADNSFLFAGATTGMVGLIIYLYLVVSMFQFSIFNFQFSIKSQLLKILTVSIGGLIVHSFFTNTLFYPWTMEWVWVLLVVVENELDLA